MGKKGFIQVNIAAYIWRPMTEAEKAKPDAMGDFVEAQPIMHDIYIPVIAEDATPGERENLLRELPDGLLTEVHAVMEELTKFVRLHKPSTLNIVPMTTDTSLQEAPKAKLLDAKGGELKPTKH